MPGAETRGIAPVRAALQHRMADEPRGQAVPREEIGLERQQAEQLVPEPGEVADAPLAPGPDLRRDVVNARDPERADGLQHAQGEAGLIDGDDHVRPARRDLRFGLPEPGLEQAQPRQDFDDAP